MSDLALPIATAFIAKQEGFREHPYRDEVGNWTVGFGFTYLPDGSKVTADIPPVQEDDARLYLQSMVARVLVNVRAKFTVPVTNNQAAACTSFAYNLGTGALQHSTLLTLLNQGKFAEAADQFREWVFAGGHVSKGLVARREAERTLFLTPDDAPSTDDLNAAELQSLNPTEQST